MTAVLVVAGLLSFSCILGCYWMTDERSVI
jgi:hypothetical protein